jgi:hypothetical protein
MLFKISNSFDSEQGVYKSSRKPNTIYECRNDEAILKHSNGNPFTVSVLLGWLGIEKGRDAPIRRHPWAKIFTFHYRPALVYTASEHMRAKSALYTATGEQ